MTIYKSNYDNELYLVFKTRLGFFCENYFTKETKKMTEYGRYSFKNLKPVAYR
jgi:hypothetical protein